MPIDPNIALGVRPIEQPNMLGQMAQVMALRQAQQEYEGAEGVNQLTRQGVKDPYAYLQHGKTGRATFESILKGQKDLREGQKLEVDLGIAKIGAFRDQLNANVNDPAAAAKWLTAVNSDPLVGKVLSSVPLEDQIAGIPSDPKGFADWKNKTMLKAPDFVKHFVESADAQLGARSRIQAAGISAGPGYMNANLAREKFTLEQKQQAEIDALFGKPPSAAPAVAPMGGGGGGVPNALPAVVGATPAAPAPTNMLVPGAQAPATAGVPAAVAPPSDIFAEIRALDAKIAPLVNTGNPRASAIVQQLIAQRNALMQSAKQQYGGAETTMEVTDPKTGVRTVVKARPNEYGVLVPIEMAPVPLSTDASATGGESISSTVARPAPTPAVLKERQATEKLPEAIAMNNDAIRKIDEMIGGVDANGKPLVGAKGKPHPGFGEAVGAGFGTAFIPGTQGKSFTIRHKEVLSQAFLDAFEALKGGGAITEKEGEKATAARTRMDLAQSETEYMAAAREYQGVLKRGVENAKARMQRSGTAPAAGAQADPLGIR